jgi:hypothetical protein
MAETDHQVEGATGTTEATPTPHSILDTSAAEGAGLMPPDNTGKEQAGHFAKGQSGNPAGRPRGSRNATTLALESLLDGQAEAITQKAVELALAGDMTAIRLCMDRVLPPRKDRLVTFSLPSINSAQDAAATVSAVLAAVAAGDLTPADAGEISKLIEAFVKVFETAELAERVKRLERMTSP